MDDTQSWWLTMIIDNEMEDGEAAVVTTFFLLTVLRTLASLI